jgi:hypothetical protein
MIQRLERVQKTDSPMQGQSLLSFNSVSQNPALLVSRDKQRPSVATAVLSKSFVKQWLWKELDRSLLYAFRSAQLSSLVCLCC